MPQTALGLQKMQRAMARLFLLAAAAGSVGGAKDTDTPLQKVMQLLSDMKAKSEAEIQKEKVEFAKFSQFCTETAGIKTSDLSETDDRLESLRADIEKYTTTADRLQQEIQGHMASIEAAKQQKENSTEIRETEHKDYETELKDLSESVDAIGRAMKMLKARSDRAEDKSTSTHAASNDEAEDSFDKDLQLLSTESWKKAMSLLQLSGARGYKASEEAQELAKNLVKQLPQQPKADAYEFQSGGVIDMLNKLEKEFIKERNDLESEEFKKKTAFEQLILSLSTEIEQHSTAKSKKDSFRGSALQNLAEAKASLEETTSVRVDDKKYLDDLQAECKLKSADFAERQRVRSMEVDAIVKASEVLKTVALVQSSARPAGTVLAALRASREPSGEEKALQFLQDKARQLQSRTLDRFLQHVPHETQSVMGGIAKMLHDMVTKLQEESLKETEHKAWCDKELSGNKKTRSEKTEDADFATSEVDLLQTSIATLSGETQQLQEELSRLDHAAKEATEERGEEKATNEKNLEENKKAQKAVEAAVRVLKDFYVTGDGAALLQSSEKPGFAAGSYSDQGQSNVLRLLEVISADLVQEEVATKASETESQRLFENFMAETNAQKAKKGAMKTQKESKKASQSTALANRKSDLAQVNEELTALDEYYKTLEPKCIDTGLSYAEEVRKREETLEALKEAYQMLNQY
mmetsp:Transcript_59024/g.104884  ORF Transcript_59024/g.104884 Transcript_59024/m.104884 type:complete len:695 (-) Transcript_59024:71-2155(-)